MRAPSRALAASALLLGAACGGATSSDPAAPGDSVPTTSEAAPSDGVPDAPASTGTTAADTQADEPGGDGHMSDDEHMDDEHMTAGDAADEGTTADRVLTVTMTEFAFSPAVIEVEVGETVQFVFVNAGAIEHEAIIGDQHVQDEHREEMASGGGHHDDAVGHHGMVPAVTVAAGEVGTITHTFTEAGELIIGCHLPGHWDAGMRADVAVG